MNQLPDSSDIPVDEDMSFAVLECESLQKLHSS